MTSAALAGALTVIAVWVIQAVSAVEVPGEVAAAITTVLAVAVAYIVPEDT